LKLETAGTGGRTTRDMPPVRNRIQDRNTRRSFCFLGCQVTLMKTGQTVSVGPQDTVVIDDGVMTVNRQ